MSPTTTRRIRFIGDVADLSADDRRELFDRSTSSDDVVRDTTAAIIDAVRHEGDSALFGLARELDNVRLSSLEVPRDRWVEALESLDPALRAALERAARNIAGVHKAFMPMATETRTDDGVLIGRRPDPLRRVGVYAPGGRAAYPSSLLMGAIPARVAGVAEVIVCSPPDSSGAPPAVVLAAAEIAKVDRIFAVGGAGAVAAMAFGTETIPRVDRVVGPGNAYVAEAKLQVAGALAIDSPAGPSELLIVTDGSANPDVLARELLAQAEHDPMAAVGVVAIGEGVAETIMVAVARHLTGQPRKQIISEVLSSRGAVLSAESLDEAIAFANEYAPEHLLLAIEHPDTALALVRNAGTVFLGETSSVAFGDYMTGANHVLPTGGLARSYSGLSVLDFVRWTSYQSVDREAAARLADDVAVFADAESLPAHAAAARSGWDGEGAA
jgi:histidinol dehydrogenase